MPATFAIESINLEAASLIVQEALARGQTLKLAPLAVAVVDPRGCLKAYMAEDSTSLMRFDIAFGKAWGALGMGFGTRELERRAEAAVFFNSLQVMSEGKIVPAQGGVLIRDAGGNIVGAVGVSGDVSDQDEICAIHGISAAGLEPDTGDPE
jgi:uncharacterized protein GlcG (DUF336 family)